MEQQLHTCWSSPMWSHQVTSLMTERQDPTIEESQQPVKWNQLGTAAARKANDEKREEKHQKVINYLTDNGSTSSDIIADELGFSHGHMQHLMTAMYKLKLVAFDKGASRTRYWRLP